MIIALDVDGTLYDGEHVAAEAVAAVRAAVDRGHTAVIVSGRRHESLLELLPATLLDVLACLVCENGGVLVIDGVATLLADPLDPTLVALVRDANVPDLDVGTVALGAPVGYRRALERARDAVGATHVVVANKDSVTLLPPQCDKGTGLRAALAALGTDAAAGVLAIGDAENDVAMFEAATVAVGVANADATVLGLGIPITRSAAGLGVAEAITTYAP